MFKRVKKQNDLLVAYRYKKYIFKKRKTGTLNDLIYIFEKEWGEV